VTLVLKAPLDILLVRKLGVPSREELAMGATPEVFPYRTDVLSNVESGGTGVDVLGFSGSWL
jgi:predicted phosphoribosyltransferase